MIGGPVRILPGAMAMLVAGCSLGDTVLLPSERVAGPPPLYRKLIAGGLAGIVGDPKRVGPLQISGLRQVDSYKGPAWLVCLRAAPDGRPLDHAVFIQNEKIVDSRLAVRTDRCDEQAFEPFGALTDSQAVIR
jgi:hypothetical protein